MKWLSTTWLIPSLVIVLGIGLRLAVALRGHNFDFDSFLIVRDIVKHGGNVYAQTTRYNYGPIWFYIIFILDWIASIFPINFRHVIVGFLSLVDMGIFFVLWKKVGKTAAYLFFLNPISIIITGYHNQFDNLALLLGFLSTIIFGDDFEEALSPKKLIALLFLGLSLMTKHILFAFPLWLAVKQKGLLNKAVVIVVPLLVFVLGFIPHWNDGQQGVVQNVFLYKSLDNQFFYSLVVPKIIQGITNSHSIWFFLLTVFAFVFRKQKSLDSLLLYTCLLVATSPAITNQYLAIPIAFTAANPNLFLGLYTAIGTWHLMVDRAGLQIAALQSVIHVKPDIYYAVMIVLLCFGFIWHVWRQDILTFIKKGVSEIKSGLT